MERKRTYKILLSDDDKKILKKTPFFSTDFVIFSSCIITDRARGKRQAPVPFGAIIYTPLK